MTGEHSMAAALAAGRLLADRYVASQAREREHEALRLTRAAEGADRMHADELTAAAIAALSSKAVA